MSFLLLENISPNIMPLFKSHFIPWAFSRLLSQCGYSGRRETVLPLGTEGLQTDYHSAGTAASERRKTGPQTE